MFLTVFFLIAVCLSAANHHPNIKVSLVSKSQWQSPSFGLELINLIHDQNDEKFNIFKLISRLKQEKLLEGQTTPRDLYSFIMTSPFNPEFFINQESMDLIKTSLALHSVAPKIQAFYHFYENTVLSGSSIDESCSNWVDWGGKQVCNPKDLESVSLDEWSQPQQLLFDIFYKPNSKSARNIAVFYADVHSAEYMALFESLETLSSASPHFNFILRFKPPKTAGEGMSLSGYGVEMAVKNTEYKAVDDRDVGKEGGERESVADSQEAQEDSHDALYEDEPSIQKVSKGRINSIAPLAIAFALGTKDPFSSLVRVSLDFPKVAHLLKANGTSSAVTRLGNQMMKTVTGENQLFFLNGIALDVERFNAFELIRMMNTENAYLSKLESLGLSTSASFDLITSPPPSASNSMDWGDCFNTKSDSILWINDLEKDVMYRQFPNSLYSLRQQGYPNQFKYVRRNIFSVVFFVDFTNPAHLNELVKVQSIIRQQAPLRFGVMPILNEKSSEQERLLALALNEIRKLGGDKLYPFIEKLSAGAAADGINPAFVRLAFSEAVGKSLDTTGATSDDGLADIIAVNERLGISNSGAIFGNGRFFPLSSDWTQPVVSVYFKMATYLTEAVMSSKVTDKDDIYDFYMNLPNVYDRRHPAIFPSSLTDLEMVTFTNEKEFGKVNWIYSGISLSFIFMIGMGEERDIALTTVIAYGDASEESILDFFSNSVDALTNLQNTRLILVDTSEKGCNSKELNDILGASADIAAARESLQELKGKCSTSSKVPSLKASLKLGSKSKGYFINGRKVSLDSFDFTRDDLVTLVGYEYSNRIKAYTTMVIDALSESKLAGAELENRILCITTVMSSAKSMVGLTGDPIKRQPLSIFSQFEGSKIHFKVGDSTTSKFRFVAAIQPISVAGQKILSVLDKLKRISGVSIDVYAIGTKRDGDDDKLPLMRFYTFVMETEPLFTTEGKVAPSLALFPKLPTSALLTLGMDVPGAWLVRPKRSVYDLDNIKLSSVPSGRNLEAEFGLEYLLVQGHSLDKNTQQPPRGLQFVLGTPKQDLVDESITMSNLGYIQLKGAPGVWQMKIREGRSSEVYKLYSLQSGTLEDSTVVVDSFEGVTLHPVVSKRPGMQDADVLVESESSVVRSVWNNIKASVFKEEKNKTVNVFSVASGHLYERFMAIMMLSVKKQSKHPVKFWLIENFLSPNFLEFLPHLAQAFDFDYELVTYKWPHWLRKQTEKQRIIWGYKILFLDVLFPLSLEKIIFVDADQVVRTDLIELVDLDLKGAVYGYTPFCSSRTEMDGFRFWKGGYWESHLAGRPYHISALYVIDLVKFRAFAAGDRLRQQYHMLSADPNSLSNLDQDLPNNMIHEIPMFSLPQDWLWCETWCSDDSLKTAKTIDLCNNPLTKEPKLERAKRILPEWVGLDDEVAKVRNAFEKGLLSTIPTSSKEPLAETDSPGQDDHSEL